MADERATITIAVTDEASAKLKEIADALENMRRRAQEASKSTEESARRSSDEHDKHKHHIAQTISAYATLGERIRTSIGEATRGLQAMGGAMGPVAKSLEAASIAGRSFGLAIGGAGTATAAVVAAAGAATVAMHLLSRSFAEAYSKAQLFRDMMNNQNQAMIDRLVGARKLIGMTTEEAQRSILSLNNMLRDAQRGAASNMAQIARQLGPGWSRMASEISNMISVQGKSIDEVREKFLDYIAAQNDPEVKRIAIEAFHIDPREIYKREQIKRLHLEIVPTIQAITDAQKRLEDETLKTEVAWQNLKTTIWNAVGPSALAMLTAFEQGLNKILTSLSSGDWSKLNPFDPKNLPPEQQGQPDKLLDPLLRRLFGGQKQGTPQRFGDYGGADLRGLSDAWKSNFIKGIMTPENIARGAARTEWRTGVGQPGQQLDQYGQPVATTAAGQSQQDIANQSRQSTDYLRDIRDILQALASGRPVGTGPGMGAGGGGGGDGGGGAGGTGFGGALGGFAGGGGGRARTGSPWFGGAAGRGTGGFPNMPQGGPGGGQDFYNQALAQVKASGLVGQVPPDGAQFGITSGSAEEWARFMTGVAKAESGFNPRSANTSDPGGSFGVLQYAHNQVPGGNAYDTGASISAFIRDAQQAMSSGGIRSPASLLRRRFSTIGSHPERTIRNLVNYGNAGQVGGQQGGPTTVSGGLGTSGGSAPGYVGGTVSVGGQMFHWGSGGGGAGSIPSGTFPVNFGDIGNVGRRIGSIAGLGGPGGTIWDPRLGRNRQGIQIHPNTHGSDLDRLYTAGCFSVPQNEWGAFRDALLSEARRNPGGLFLQVDRNGQAVIGPRGAGGGGQQVAGVTGAGYRGGPGGPPSLGVSTGRRGGGGVGTGYAFAGYGGGHAGDGGGTIGAGGAGGYTPGPTGGEFEPRDETGQPLHRAVGREAARIGAASKRQARAAEARASHEERMAAAEGAPIGGAARPGQTADRPSGGEAAPFGGAAAVTEAGRRMQRILRSHRNIKRDRLADKSDEDLQADMDESLRKFRQRKGLEEETEPLSRRALFDPAVRRQEEEERKQRRKDREDLQRAEREGHLASGPEWAHSRRRLERERAARLDVNVSAPKGTKVKTDGGDVFKDVKTRQVPQMAKSDGQNWEE